LIGRLARLSEMSAAAAGEAPKGSIQLVHEEATVALPIGDVIDIEQEKARLKKEEAKHAGEIDKLRKKLSNQGFLAKAPQAVIDENRERFVEHEARQAQIRAALKRLDEL
jgi:valyl-tRNA synthetase